MRKLAVLVFVGLISSTALAEPIKLKNGGIRVFDMLGGDAIVWLVGVQPFTFEGAAQNASLNIMDCFWGCSPAEAVSVGLQALRSDLPGVVEYEGETYPNVGSDPFRYDSLTLQINGSGFAPRAQTWAENTPIVKRYPVTIRGSFMHGYPVPETETISGKGRAMVTWEFRAGQWSVEAIRYVVTR